MKLYPTSETSLTYALLVTIPSTGMFATILLYEWFGNYSVLADAVLEASLVATGYSTIAFVVKIGRLLYLRKRSFAWSRTKIAAKTLLINVAVIGGYLAWRFTTP